MCDLFSFQITFLTLTLLFSIGCWPNPATVYMSGLDAVLEERPNIRLADSQDIKEIKKEIVASLKGYKLSLKSESRVSRKEYSDYRMDYQKNYPQKTITQVGSEDGETTIWRFAGRCHAPDKTVNAWELIVIAHGRHIWARRYNDRPGSLKCQPQFAKDWVKIIAEGIQPATIVDPFCRPLEGSMWVADDYKRIAAH